MCLFDRTLQSRFLTLQQQLSAIEEIIFCSMQRLRDISCLKAMLLESMLLKRKILLVFGIVVAIVVGLYTGLFGMTL
jgi:hypothetical protein